ncbi:MAG: hypothetical protein HS122_09275 [Opitutaceae bacterium]|nr:hypothetical protein [Opitutaceae bacterium]
MSAIPRQRLLMIAAISIVALFLVDRLLVTPLSRHWTARSQEIGVLKRSLASGAASIERSERTHQLWKEIQDGALPKDAAIAEQLVLNAFDQWGRDSRVEIGSIKPQWKRGANPRYSVLECRVDASGSLANLVRLLYDVERSPLALRIDAVELSSRDDQGQRLSIGMTVSGLRLAALEGRP